MSIAPGMRLPPRRSVLDRDAPTRIRPGAIAELAADGASRVLVLNGRSALAGGGVLRLLPAHELPPGAFDSADAVVYLGRSLAESAAEPVGTPVLALAVTDEMAAAIAGAEWVSLRSLALGADARPSIRDFELLATALALVNWHASHGFSPLTGEPSTSEDAGWVRRGTNPAHDLYPRTDPSVIVAVLDEHDRILLGSNALWEKNRFSLLAGFVEPGESLEGAVEREVFEESGIHVTDAQYLGSQPWPFPLSLMLGFSARVDPERLSTLTPDGEEILELRWFSRDELRDALDDIILPGHSSIARAIIELWYGGEIVDGSATGRSR
ncbi:NAD+ diphosphatase [Homoserinimonas aerilata]|uniref:NAD(+) diphosphatase n=1 Tax=Homoserinimonas aerilata TaxID=1162970 RepID=A0A542YH17_9MICO|nr:NAD(+) diphosphatase [Homoserinimonas aerilata]TQL47387.1 NAD+ diphosphatase [Homoserinimonas aerilata]